MGLFDRLFGKKEKKEEQEVLENKDNVTDEVERDNQNFVQEDVGPSEEENLVIVSEEDVQQDPTSEDDFVEQVDSALDELDSKESSSEVVAIESDSKSSESMDWKDSFDFEELEEGDFETSLGSEVNIPEHQADLSVDWKDEIAVELDKEKANDTVEEDVTEASTSQSLETLSDSEETSSSEVVLESQVEVLSTTEVASQSNDPRFESLMADYYAKKAAVAEAAERGETLSFEAMSTRQVQELSKENAPASTPEIEETTEEKYNRSLKKTRTGFAARLNEFFANFRKVDEEFFEELEEMLIMSDVGVTVATQLTEELRQEARLENAKKPEDLRQVVIEKLVDIYEKDGVYKESINFQDDLTVMLFVGVNGVGKTTSIGKLAYQYKNQGKKVMLVAADTFRAGAVAQLVEWGRRVDVPVVTGPEKADPASVVFDGMERAVVEGIDVLMIDTAGRLQNKDNLMKELEKIGRIIKRVVPEAPHETLLALDASTGQNALSQAKEFSKITPLTGLVLTKIDGTAKGGVVLAIRQELDIPVKLIGFGEKIDDIGSFNSENFMRGLLEGLL
ncbi:signal recognition particle-docking protein FtsY [Streptococcus pluranimalium]|uniref:signal recognition particle-docking protein FtsY n=2 Tax=Streptococcus pluranimalium TaxID=82348 RepID=UPI00292E7ADF|nr:signal recognition particle-docking protein FtsY [Streptococcus pluranimalium]HEM6117082.1 signal recognition particle-docking protein FtsY [Streptococcus suis]HEM6117527.1 signal recognition particle-docking protein FtsY [Streptococcus suis]